MRCETYRKLSRMQHCLKLHEAGIWRRFHNKDSNCKIYSGTNKIYQWRVDLSQGSEYWSRDKYGKIYTGIALLSTCRPTRHYDQPEPAVRHGCNLADACAHRAELEPQRLTGLSFSTRVKDIFYGGRRYNWNVSSLVYNFIRVRREWFVVWNLFQLNIAAVNDLCCCTKFT